MGYSKLVQYIKYSPNHSGKRKSKIKHIVPHHTAGVIGVESLGNIFANRSRQASSNYGIGHDGRIALYVDEDNQAWTTSNRQIDDMAVTFELSNSAIGGNWLVSDLVINRFIELATDVCYRHGIYPCTYTGDKRGTIHLHKWYWSTACPGPYLESKMPYIAQEITKRLTALRTPKIPLEPLVPVPVVPKVETITVDRVVKDTKTVTKMPYMKLKRDAYLWDFDQTSWNAFKGQENTVKLFKKGAELQLADEVKNRLGSTYGRTPYSSQNKIFNGINKVDYDIIYK